MDESLVVIIERLCRVSLDGLRDAVERPVIPALLVRNQPEQMEGVGMGRILREDFLITGFGLGQSPRPVMGDRLLQQLFNNDRA